MDGVQKISGHICSNWRFNYGFHFTDFFHLVFTFLPVSPIWIFHQLT